MKILAFSLSLRKNSCNSKLIQIVVDLIHKDHKDQLEIEILNLSDYEMPAYNQDLEEQHGLPKNAELLKEKLSKAQALIIASPEYNYSYPGSFKNIFDWISRFRPNPWQKKYVLLLSASPALAGGERALWPLRVPFEGSGSIVYPQMFSLPLAYQAFDENNKLLDLQLLNKLSMLIKNFVEFIKKLN